MRLSQPTLRFAPDAWAKLLFFRDREDVEIGGFGITDDNDPLLVREFVTVKQMNSVVTVGFEDQAVADFFDVQVDQGRKPSQFLRIWLHSHPGDCPLPSSVDEETFNRVFGSCDWAVMFIIARNGETYARLRFNVGPGGSVELPVQVEYGAVFGPSDHPAWAAEYDANINNLELTPPSSKQTPSNPFEDDAPFNQIDPAELTDEWFDFGFLESQELRQW